LFENQQQSAVANNSKIGHQDIGVHLYIAAVA